MDKTGRLVVCKSRTVCWSCEASDAVMVIRGAEAGFSHKGVEGQPGGDTRVRIGTETYTARGGQASIDYNGETNIVVVRRLRRGEEIEVEVGKGGSGWREGMSRNGDVTFYPANAGGSGYV